MKPSKKAAATTTSGMSQLSDTGLEKLPQYKNRRDVVFKALLRSLKRFFVFTLSSLSGKQCDDGNNSLPSMTNEEFEEALAKLMALLEREGAIEFGEEVSFKLAGFIQTVTAKFARNHQPRKAAARCLYLRF
jgi:hypothetical protein